MSDHSDLIILLHSSKTMRAADATKSTGSQLPVLIKEANELAAYLKTFTVSQLQDAMKLSPAMAEKTHSLIESYDSQTSRTLPAIDCFLGDIYSGLQVQTFSQEDRQYANHHLFILSGLYGVLRALDTIQPYRLEMGYKLPAIPSLYTYWGDKIAGALPESGLIINLSAVEYTKAIFPHFKTIEGLKNAMVVTPKFLTVSPKTGAPIFVTVHAKIARGAFARWLIQRRIKTLDALKEFNDLGYAYDAKLSTVTEPVFVAKEFQGIGLSVRLTDLVQSQ